MFTPELPVSRKHSLASTLVEKVTASVPPGSAPRDIASEVPLEELVLFTLPGLVPLTADIGESDSTIPLNCWLIPPAMSRMLHCSLLRRVMSTPLLVGTLSDAEITGAGGGVKA